MSKPLAKIPRTVICRFTNSPITKFKIKRGRTAREFSLIEPDIIFSEWYSWDDVKNIPNGHRTGLYIIARFDEKPIGPAQPDAKEIIYIGETHGKSQCISKRLQIFFKAAHIGEKIHKHSGGNRFNRTIGKDLSNMYAAGFAPILENVEAINPFIFYAERKLIWDYVRRWQKMPICNGK